MSSARDRIMARLRSHNIGEAPDLDFSVIDEKQWPLEERIDRLQQAMESVHTEVHRISREQLQDKLGELVVQKEIKRLCYAPGCKLGQSVAEKFSSQGSPELVPYADEIEKWKEDLFFNIDASVTTTLGGVAETGSLLLWPDNNEPRLMSLVPPIHIAVLEASQIHSTLREVMQRQGWHKGMPTNALMISGPSKTADIEQTLAYGVHGPKELIVLVVQD